MNAAFRTLLFMGSGMLLGLLATWVARLVRQLKNTNTKGEG